MKKTKLTPLQNRILSMLEGAGEKTLQAIRATLLSEGERDVWAISMAVEGLRKLGFVSIAGLSAALTEIGRAARTA